MSRRISLLVFCMLGMAGVSLGQDPLREPVRAAWKEREAKVRTARFEWKQTVVTVKGALDDAKELIMTRNGGKDPGTSPPEDFSYTSNCALAIDGDRVAFEFSRREWNASRKLHADTRTEYKFDGKKQLILNHRGYTDWPVARIRAMPRGAELTWDMVPLLLNLRGTSDKFQPEDLDEYATSGAVLAIGGVQGRELLSKGGPGRDERHLWVDPGRGFVVLRYTMGDANRQFRQIDVKYKPDGTVGWVPAEWKIVETSRKDGRIRYTTTATVTSYTINQPLDDDAFAFTLPLGCRVSDDTKTPRDYIIRDDGTTRVMAPGDFGKTYQEIVDSPGPPSAAAWRRWTGLLLAGFLGLGVLLLVAKVWLIRRTNRQPLPPSPGSSPGLQVGEGPA